MSQMCGTCIWRGSPWCKKCREINPDADRSHYEGEDH